jgi:hypothetical protein
MRYPSTTVTRSDPSVMKLWREKLIGASFLMIQIENTLRQMKLEERGMTD